MRPVAFTRAPRWRKLCAPPLRVACDAWLSASRGAVSNHLLPLTRSLRGGASSEQLLPALLADALPRGARLRINVRRQFSLFTRLRAGHCPKAARGGAACTASDSSSPASSPPTRSRPGCSNLPAPISQFQTLLTSNPSSCHWPGSVIRECVLRVPHRSCRVTSSPGPREWGMACGLDRSVDGPRGPSRRFRSAMNHVSGARASRRDGRLPSSAGAAGRIASWEPRSFFFFHLFFSASATAAAAARPLLRGRLLSAVA